MILSPPLFQHIIAEFPNQRFSFEVINESLHIFVNNWNFYFSKEFFEYRSRINNALTPEECAVLHYVPVSNKDL